MLEINTLINYLNVSKSQDISKQLDNDPYKKVIKSKNEVFANNSEIDKFLESRKEHQNSMLEVKMDKTFHLTQHNKESTQFIIDMDSKYLEKIMFQANQDAVTLAKIISMPNKVLVTCGSSYIVRIWTLLGSNLCLLNLEYPLPYKWNLMINRFHQRKIKYIKAKKIMKELEKRWYRRNSVDRTARPKSPFIKKDPLEKDKNIVTFKSLVSEMKDKNSSCLTLRKIDAIKRINLEQVNKSPLDIQLEMLENNIAESENKKNIGSIEEMKRDINGGIITGKLPTFSIEYEEIGGSIKQKIQRIDSDHVSPNHGLSNRDILPNKDLKDIVEDMLNVPFKPQPYMIDTMK